jgi:hypothetical protein
MAQNLTNLANLSNWIQSPAGTGQNTADNPTLNRLIAAQSRAIMTYLGRQSIFNNVITNDKYTGNGTQSLLVQQWPVITMNQVLVNNVAIPAALDSTVSGWLLQPWDGFSAGRPQMLQLNGYSFEPPVGCGSSYGGGMPYNGGFTRNDAMTSAKQNVVLSYTTGYLVQGETVTIPTTPYQITALQANGTWGQDDGLTIAGVAGVPVASAPTTGQYSVSAGVYTFAAADTGKAVVLNYSYIPSDIEQACIEWCAEKYMYKGRIGQKSKSLAGQETTSYNIAGMTDSIKVLLQPYKSVIFKR